MGYSSFCFDWLINELHFTNVHFRLKNRYFRQFLIFPGFKKCCSQKQSYASCRAFNSASVGALKIDFSGGLNFLLIFKVIRILFIAFNFYTTYSIITCHGSKVSSHYDKLNDTTYSNICIIVFLQFT